MNKYGLRDIHPLTTKLVQDKARLRTWYLSLIVIQVGFGDWCEQTRIGESTLCAVN